LTDFEPLISIEELPPDLAAHARAFVASGQTPAAPRLAATVLLLRPDGVDYRVFMIRRVPTMPFAPGMYAFPGGSVDQRDEDAQLRWEGPSPSNWADRLGQAPAVAQSIVCAAVREVFEETGVLLADVDPEASFEDERAALVERRLGFAEFAATHDLVLRADLLAPWGRWITPVFEPRRYDTYFFLARLPAGQAARNVGGEADHVSWLRPSDSRGLPMLPPTRVTLRELAAHSSIESLMEASASRDAATPVIPRLPIRSSSRILDSFRRDHGRVAGHCH
jgi:8-oxo-dGTP pyrophosphatase MutT (NUDIX family)